MRFSVAGFPVTIEPSFLLMVAILGGVHADAVTAVVWIAVVFISILVHELGHAFAARGYGFEPAILLHSMGGLTIWQPHRRVSERQQILISAAGPLAGFSLGALVWAVSFQLPPGGSYLAHLAVWNLLWVNIGWGVLNLLPIIPLDGGNIMLSLITAAGVRRGPRLAYQISILISLLICAVALNAHMLWGAMLAGWLAYQNFRTLNPR